MHAIQVGRTGGPEVLEWTEVAGPEAGDGELLVRLGAVGLNFIDTYHRTGLYPVDLPFVPGMEGAGTVEEVGQGVEGFEAGDRVAWADVLRSYAELARVPAGRAVRVPEGVGTDQAAAVMLQGMTAHYLAHDTYPLQPGDPCLVHAGAGGVGHLLVQIAKRLGATVLVTVGSEEKAELARKAGADHAILYRDRDFGEAAEKAAGERRLAVVYDGVGKATFDRSLELLRPRGVMVAYGNASGPVEPVDPLRLSRGGSLYLTRPTLFNYISTREDLEQRAGDLFSWIAAGELDVHIGERFPLADAADAHRSLEGRRTTGKVLLEP
ncbi:MAG: quinone oxidoreductase family protein [Acidimicrobiia bacterium]